MVILVIMTLMIWGLGGVISVEDHLFSQLGRVVLIPEACNVLPGLKVTEG
jgi:hypothetical protein